MREVAMFLTGKTSKARAAQRVAEDAWDHLVSAMESAGDTARSASRKTYDVADEVGSTVTAAADEARRRAAAALDALAGRRQRMHWEWIAGAVVAGLVVGWFAASGARRVAASGGEGVAPAETKPLDATASPEY
jgi:hypothetical protein